MAQERKNSCGAGAPIACGRAPFAGDSACDRGDVDIHAFDDFPMCGILDPTVPDMAGPQIDFPVIPIPPPPCACIDIDVKGNVGIAGEDDPGGVSAGFRAVGDCCEGHYEMDINIDIPCIPFGIDGGGEFPIDLDCNCHVDEPYGTFDLGIVSEDCEIRFNPSMHLEIPIPKDIEFEEAVVNLKTPLCKHTAEADFYLEEEGGGDCKRKIVPHLELSIPKTVAFETCETWDVNISQGGDKLGGEGTVDLEVEYEEGGGDDSGECGVMKFMCPTFNLDLPCPLSDITFQPIVNWSEDISPEATLKKSEDSCAFEGALNLEINIPCPLDGLEIVGAPPRSESDPYIVATKIDGNKLGSGSGDGECFARWELSIVMPMADDSSGSMSGSSSSSSSGSSRSSSSTSESESGGSIGSSASSGGSSPGSKSGSGSGSGSGSKSGSGGSGGSGSPEPPQPKVDSFVAVTDVKCSEKGGIEVISSTFTIDFTNGKVSSAENVQAKGPEAANMARRIFATTIEALRKDPSLASIVDDPYSDEARNALARLGFADGIAGEKEDDSFIEDWRNGEWEP